MPSFLRSLSQRFRSKPNVSENKASTSAPASVPTEINSRKEAQCKVILLDGTNISIVIPRKALGQEVYDKVFSYLDLEERDYFGLQFTDHYHVAHWLDPLKTIKKQVPIGPPCKYQFFLQLKHDIQSGKLECPKDLAIDLGALALQSEFGDYNPKDHTALFVSEFRFHPEQDELMEVGILEKFKEYRGLNPSEAEMNYLNKAKWIELYGVDMHQVEGKDKNVYRLGLTPTGMLVFDGLQKIGLFLWEKIQRLDFKNRKLTLVVEEEAEQAIQLHTFVFELTSHKACKHLWKCAIEHHTFFRLKFHKPPKRARDQLFRLGSTFKYRGRTEYENVHRDKRLRRTNSTFKRGPSQRYMPRQSHLHRLKMEERQALSSRLPTTPSTTALPLDTSITSNVEPHAPSGFLNGTPDRAVKVAAAEARLDNLIFSGIGSTQLSTTPAITTEPPVSGKLEIGRKSDGIEAKSSSSTFIGGKLPDVIQGTVGDVNENVTKIEIKDKPPVLNGESPQKQEDAMRKPTMQPSSVRCME
ncbi:Ferm domain [Aphelenchoides avenae]|nr:Ferm domain [Aphelenchus avenae]